MYSSPLLSNCEDTHTNVPRVGLYRLVADYHNKAGSRAKDADPWSGKRFPKGMVVFIEHITVSRKDKGDSLDHTLVYAHTPVPRSYGHTTDRLFIGSVVNGKWQPETDTLCLAIRGLLVQALISDLSERDILCLARADYEDAFRAMVKWYQAPRPEGYTEREILWYAFVEYGKARQAREDSDNE